MSNNELINLNFYQEAKNKLSGVQVCHRHTKFQLEHFIIEKEITHQSKMQKCLKEMEVRVTSIGEALMSLEDTKDDIELLNLKKINIEKKKTKNNINKKFKEIHLRKTDRKIDFLNNSLKSLNKKIKETQEEIEYFINKYKELEKIEPLKDYDDVSENKNFWNKNFSRELQLRLMMQKPIDLELMKCILSLNNDSPVKIETIKMLEQIQSQAINLNKIEAK